MNRPLSERVCVSLKCWTTRRSSGDRLEGTLGLSSISQNFLSESSAEVTETLWVAIERQTEVCELVLPARTQPNMVSRQLENQVVQTAGHATIHRCRQQFPVVCLSFQDVQSLGLPASNP